jgi:hypothetical protein
MDPVPLGLGLTLIAIILYLLSELSNTRRDLAKVSRDLEAHRQSPTSERLEHAGAQRYLIDAKPSDRSSPVEVTRLASKGEAAG